MTYAEGSTEDQAVRKAAVAVLTCDWSDLTDVFASSTSSDWADQQWLQLGFTIAALIGHDQPEGTGDDWWELHADPPTATPLPSLQFLTAVLNTDYGIAADLFWANAPGGQILPDLIRMARSTLPKRT